MTKQEFILKQKGMRQRANKFVIGWFILFLGGFCGMIPFARYSDQHSEVAWIQPLQGIYLVALLVGSIALLLWFGKRQQKRFGHVCPACGKPLIGMSVQVAIASGNCGHCGEKVFT